MAKYYGYRIEAGPFKGRECRILNQFAQSPSFMAVQIRPVKGRKENLGPWMVPFEHIKPKDAAKIARKAYRRHLARNA